MKNFFPVFQVYPELVYLDSAGTTQKPKAVLEAIEEYYVKHNANIDGAYELSISANRVISETREMVGQFLGVATDTVVFVPSVTYAVSIVSFGVEHMIEKGDSILVTKQEHHSNLLPWRELANRTGTHIVEIPTTLNGEIDLVAFENKLKTSAKIVVCSHISNVIGCINPLEEMYTLSKRINPAILFFVDGSQSVAHGLGSELSQWSDIFVFSSHKMYGPLGIAILSGKKEFLEQLTPVFVGGKMVATVSNDPTTRSHYRELPYRLEAGTPDGAAIAGLGAALRFLQIHYKHDRGDELIQYAENELLKLGHVRVIGEGLIKKSLLSFYSTRYDSTDIGVILARDAIAVRTGLQCATPLHTSLQLEGGSVRISTGIYTETSDIDKFLSALHRAFELLQ